VSAKLVVVGGGVRSGKSSFALARAEALGARRVFVATGEALDGEMDERIARHRAERGDRFLTIEAPVELPAVLAAAGAREAEVDVVLVDCLTLWLSNLLVRDEPVARVLERVDELVRVLARRSCHTIIVTNEVGMGVVPPSPLGRAFRDVAGTAHQRLAAVADELHLAVLGTVLRLRPPPITGSDHAAR
jgi:adenosylcobinamide kinase/adenosylcobinamide-phosphate guanylyltransferase